MLPINTRILRHSIINLLILQDHGKKCTQVASMIFNMYGEKLPERRIGTFTSWLPLYRFMASMYLPISLAIFRFQKHCAAMKELMNLCTNQAGRSTIH